MKKIIKATTIAILALTSFGAVTRASALNYNKQQKED